MNVIWKSFPYSVLVKCALGKSHNRSTTRYLQRLRYLTSVRLAIYFIQKFHPHQNRNKRPKNFNLMCPHFSVYLQIMVLFEILWFWKSVHWFSIKTVAWIYLFLLSFRWCDRQMWGVNLFFGKAAWTFLLGKSSFPVRLLSSFLG